jgi:hypothetical protein
MLSTLHGSTPATYALEEVLKAARIYPVPFLQVVLATQ